MKKVKVCNVRLNFSVDYYVAANDNKGETAIDIAYKNIKMKLDGIIGSDFLLQNAEITSQKEVDFE